ncbi:MAG: hypothetical protein KAH23_04290 [Kiritimatiellae bacterium]|nr:hypothetical protein [Kiritimatiellia bacterium]
MNSSCYCAGRYSKNFVIYQKRPETPPTIFVDNNPGAIAYAPLPSGYMNPSLYYSNILEAMGISFYATNESIGAMVVKNDIMYSITDMEVPEFFTVTPPDQAEVSLVSVMQVDEGVIYIAAILNIDPSAGKVVFASKTVSYDGLVLSCPTTVEHFTATSSEKGKHGEAFNEDGTSTGEDPTSSDEDSEGNASRERLVTYEDYNGSHGFGDIRIQELSLGRAAPDAMKKINELVVDDIHGINSSISNLPQSGVYSIESFSVIEDLHFIALQDSSLTVESIYGDGSSDYISHTFKEENKQSEFFNVYSRQIAYLPPTDFINPKNYYKTYAPAGIFKRYKEPAKILVTRLEEGAYAAGPFEGIATYEIGINSQDDSEGLNFDPILNDNDELVATDTLKIDGVTYSDMKYCFFGKKRTVNLHIGVDDVAGSNRATVHRVVPAETLKNQKVDIISVKSMSNFMAYITPTE